MAVLSDTPEQLTTGHWRLADALNIEGVRRFCASRANWIHGDLHGGFDLFHFTSSPERSTIGSRFQIDPELRELIIGSGAIRSGLRQIGRKRRTGRRNAPRPLACSVHRQVLECGAGFPMPTLVEPNLISSWHDIPKGIRFRQKPNRLQTC